MRKPSSRIEEKRVGSSVSIWLVIFEHGSFYLDAISSDIEGYRAKANIIDWCRLLLFFTLVVSSWNEGSIFKCNVCTLNTAPPRCATRPRCMPTTMQVLPCARRRLIILAFKPSERANSKGKSYIPSFLFERRRAWSFNFNFNFKVWGSRYLDPAARCRTSPSKPC